MNLHVKIFVAGAALCEPPGADFVAGAALCEPPCADFVAGTALCEPPGADFVAGAIQNAFWRDSGRTKCCIFSIEPVASNLASLALRNDGCEMVSGHSWIMLGSWSGMVGIVPPSWID